jgi:hypothetical protein
MKEVAVNGVQAMQLKHRSPTDNADDLPLVAGNRCEKFNHLRGGELQK